MLFKNFQYLNNTCVDYNAKPFQSFPFADLLAVAIDKSIPMTLYQLLLSVVNDQLTTYSSMFLHSLYHILLADLAHITVKLTQEPKIRCNVKC